MTASPIDIRRKQLLYRAQHRGFKEADLLIGGFAAANLGGMSEAELDEFEKLIGFPDHDIYDWAMGKKKPPAEVTGKVFDGLSAFDVAAITAPKG